VSEMYTCLQVKNRLILWDFNESWIFLSGFSKNKISNAMEIHPVVAEFIHADGRTDMAKLLVPFRYFATEPQKYI
jgi:hypothetical protein